MSDEVATPVVAEPVAPPAAEPQPADAQVTAPQTKREARAAMHRQLRQTQPPASGAAPAATPATSPPVVDANGRAHAPESLRIGCLQARGFQQLSQAPWSRPVSRQACVMA